MKNKILLGMIKSIGIEIVAPIFFEYLLDQMKEGKVSKEIKQAVIIPFAKSVASQNSKEVCSK